MIHKTIKLYENREDVTLTTYVLEDSPELLNGKKRPAVLICPGGAYLSCSDREAEPVAMTFNAMGFHAFVLRYSTYNEGQGMGMMALEDAKVKEQTQFPHPMQEIGQSFLMIREHADEWFVDADQIAVCGFSAGAHNCAMYSVYWDSAYMTEHFNRPAKDFRPAAAILSYTLSDYVFMKENAEKSADPMAGELFGLSNLSFTGTPTPDDETLDKISPARHVTKNTPPTFLWATAKDNLVPVQHTYLMAMGLANAGVEHEVHVFENGDHGLSTANEAAAGALSQMSAEVVQWMSLAEKFLKRHISFPLPKMTPWEEMMQKH